MTVVETAKTSRAMSPIVFERIDTLPFVDAHVRQSSGGGSACFDMVTGHSNPDKNATDRAYQPGKGAPQQDLQRPAQHAVLTDFASPSVKTVGLQDGRSQTAPEGENAATLSRGPSTNSSHSSVGHHGKNNRLEDYDDIDAAQVDRYGFYNGEQTLQRRMSSSSLDAARLRSRGLKRQSTLSRRGLKRASMNIGLSAPTDYLEPPKVVSIPVQKEVARSQKWMGMAVRSGTDSHFEFKITGKLRSRVYKGIPDCWRASAWSSFLNNPTSRMTDHELLQQYDLQIASPCESDDQIDLDVPRTISGHVLFRRRHEGGQRLLFRVLHAITLQCPTPGYVQGMSSIAATLLCYYPEDQAFVMLYRLWTERGLAKLYEVGFGNLVKAFDSLEEKMRQTQVGRHLLSIGCQPTAWATRWYLTIFHVSVPFRTQLRIWDILMLDKQGHKDGEFRVLEATTLALIEGIEDILLGTDFDQAMRLLTMPVVVQDDDRLIRAVRKKLQ